MGAFFVGDGALDVPLTHQVFQQTYRTVAPPSFFCADKFCENVLWVLHFREKYCIINVIVLAETNYTIHIIKE